MTITPNRLRELIRAADDRAADASREYQDIQLHRDIAAALRELQAGAEGSAAPAAEPVARNPDGYAYRYPAMFNDGTVIRFNNGQEVNGLSPIEAVPYWLGAPPPVALATEPVATDRERGIWRAAITLANNICVQECDRINDDDGPIPAIDATNECAKRIREWVAPADDQFAEMVAEAGVPAAPPPVEANQLAAYQQWVMDYWLHRRDPAQCDLDAIRHLFVMTVGLPGEAGEAVEIVKKWVRKGQRGPIDVDALRLELGDTLYYLARLAGEFGITLQSIVEANREKLEARRARDVAGQQEVQP